MLEYLKTIVKLRKDKICEKNINNSTFPHEKHIKNIEI